jgi:hypothetical protein
MSANPLVIPGQRVDSASTVKTMQLGTRVRGKTSDGLPVEFIYIQAGAEGLTVGQVAIFSAAFVSTLLDQNGTASDTGPVGVAMCTVAADSYGWLQTLGPATVSCLADITSGAAVYSSTTAGSVDDTASDGDQVLGARFSAAEPATEGDGFVTVDLMYPWAGFVDTHA